MTTRIHTREIALGAAAALLASAPACSSSDETPASIDIEVSNVYVTEPVLGERAVMYFSIANGGSADDELMSVSTEVAGVAEIHRTEGEGGMMQMVPVDALTVPAGARVDLAPGGYHVMLVELQRHLFPRDRFDVTLGFRHAGDVVARARVIPYEEIEDLLDTAAHQRPSGTR